MTRSSDDFARSFDSIAVSRTATAAAARPEAALAFDQAAPGDADHHPYAGFSLLDDAGGRFIIDRETGIITLLHDDLLATDCGGVYGVRVRCVEYSGACYDLALKLKITGRVPQIADSAEDNLALANLAVGALSDTGRPVKAPAPAAPPPQPAEAWTRFAAFQNHAARRPLAGEGGPFGALLSVDLPDVDVRADALTLGLAPPAPTSATADWQI